MKTLTFLFALLAGAPILFAQNKPTSAFSPQGFYELRNNFPGLKRDFTQMKINAYGEYSYSYRVNVNSTDGIIASTAFSNESSDWLFRSYRSSAAKTGNRYVANIEIKEDGQWTNAGTEIGYFDEYGNDTLWEMGSAAYRRKLVKKYDANGHFIWSGTYYETNDQWIIENERSIVYEDGRRVTDTSYYYSFGEGLKPATLIEYTYQAGKLDSIAVSEFISGYPVFTHAFKLKKASDGGILQIRTYTDDLDQGAIVLSEFAEFTGGTSGIQEINTELATVYPVPANGMLNIALKNTGEHTMQLLDMSGRCMLTGMVSANASVDVSSLPPGIYVLFLQDDRQQTSRQLVSVYR